MLHQFPIWWYGNEWCGSRLHWYERKNKVIRSHYLLIWFHCNFKNRLGSKYFAIVYSYQLHCYRARITDGRRSDGTWWTLGLDCPNRFIRTVQLALGGYELGATNIRFYCTDDNGENSVEKYRYINGQGDGHRYTINTTRKLIITY